MTDWMTMYGHESRFKVLGGSGGILWLVAAVGCGSGSGLSTIDPDSADVGFRDEATGALRPALVFVERVTDGDTITVRADREMRTPDGQPMSGQRIRLLGIDTPELGRNGQGDECYAAEARSFVVNALGGRTVTLEFDETRCRPPDAVQACRGDFGRLLAYVRLSEVEVLNERLLRTGHARVLRGPDRFRHRDSERYESLERSAARAGVGLWTCP